MKRREFITLLGGTAVAWPLVGRTQQGATPGIGFFSRRSAGESASVVSAFRKGLQEIGYTDNQNVQIIYRWAEGQFDRLPALAAEIVERRVSVIGAVGGAAA